MSQNKNNADWERLLQAQKETERQLREQKLQLDAALNNMLQGLCMFDADEKIVLFNQRYVDMMNLPGGDVLGLSLPDLMRRRKASGLFAGDPESLADEVLASMRAGQPVTKISGISRRPRAALRQSADAERRLGGDVRGHHRAEGVRKRTRAAPRVSESDPRQRAGDDRGERRGRAEVRSRQSRGRGVLGFFPQCRRSARRCTNCFPHGKAEAIDNADIEALKSGKRGGARGTPELGRLPGTSAW